MSNYYINPNDPDSLTHFGIRGMKWGERNYQNEDGSLTPAGRERYGVGDGRHKSLADNIHQYRVKKKRSKALEKARKTKAKNAKAKQKQAEAEEQRQKNLKKNYQTDHARQVFQNMDKMSDQELNAARNRLQTEQSIQQMALTEMQKERAANPSSYEKAADFINKAIKVSADVATIANNVSKFSTAMRVIQGPNKNGNQNNKQSNNQNSNQNQNGNQKSNSQPSSDSQGSTSSSKAPKQSLNSKISDTIQNKQKTKLDKMLEKNQAGVDATNKRVADNRRELAVAAAQNRSQQQYFNENFTSYGISPESFTTRISETAPYTLKQINHGKDILMAMGLD